MDTMRAHRDSARANPEAFKGKTRALLDSALTHVRTAALAAALVPLGAIAAAPLAEAGVGSGFVQMGPFETELLSMSLMGSGQLPLGTGYELVNSEIKINESPTIQSKGTAFISTGRNFPAGITATGGGIIGDPSTVMQGDPLFVDSFFNVFFDVTVTDIDPNTNFGGGLPSMLMATGLGPANMSFVPKRDPMTEQPIPNCTADLSRPNFGCLPPPAGEVYLGHFDVVLTLPDLNGNTIPERIKFTLQAHSR